MDLEEEMPFQYWGFAPTPPTTATPDTPDESLHESFGGQSTHYTHLSASSYLT